MQNWVSTECPSLIELAGHDLIEVDFFKSYLALEPKTLEHRTSALLFVKNENCEYFTYLLQVNFEMNLDN